MGREDPEITNGAIPQTVPRQKNRYHLTPSTIPQAQDKAQKGQAGEVPARARKAVVQLQKTGVYSQPRESQI